MTITAQFHIARFGTWASPVSADAIVADTVSLDQLAIHGESVYWIEGRAREQGRSVLVRHDGHAIADVVAAPWSVRTRVHEYGGGAFVIDGDTVYFSNFADQRLYACSVHGLGAPVPAGIQDKAGGSASRVGLHAAHAPEASAAERMPAASTGLRPATEATAAVPTGARRYADAVIDRRRNRLIAVCEDHSDSTCEAVNSIVAIDLNGAEPDKTLAEGHDFYAAPRLSPDGAELAWLAWDHPDMPWDGCVLSLAAIGADGLLQSPRTVAGGRRESIFQPAWSPEGELYFISDRSGWWNLYRLRAGSVEALQPMAAEFGRAQWNFGACTYGFEGNQNVLCSYVQDGSWHLARLGLSSLEMREIALPFRTISDLKVGSGFAVLIGGAPDISNSIVRIDLATGIWTILRSASSLQIDPADLATPEAITFPTTDGARAHAFFYAPCNREYRADSGQRPPLLVISHGGPTSSTSSTLNLSIQFWTSRGFAVVDVNYGGSTGYGRAYRERLYGKWGVVDVEDAIAAARFLVAQGAIDGKQVAIRGSSAGGYTTLAALTFHDFFRAGASYYGVSDLEALARECHKFESRYLDHLVGPYPQTRATYRERSPIHFVDRLAAPLILFQGLDDKVVPPNQSQAMFDALRAKGLPVAYITFAGEAHGFRRAENIKRALEAELYFYRRVFGLAPDHTAPAVDIMNLPCAGTP